MIELAFKRNREREALTFSYDTNILDGISFGGAKGREKRRKSITIKTERGGQNDRPSQYIFK